MKHRNFLIAALIILELSSCIMEPPTPVAAPVLSGNPQNVSTFAGSGVMGSSDGTTTAASFNGPRGLAIDASGNIYVADYGNHKIRKITPAGVVSTFAGSGNAGFADGIGSAASFKNPRGLAVDAFGYVYVADSGNNCIRIITPGGVVSTLAGSVSAGAVDAQGASASFKNPSAISFAPGGRGDLYVADMGNNLIRKIVAGGYVSTVAGSGAIGSTNATGTAASFNEPFGIAINFFGDIIVADRSNHLIRKITIPGVVTTFAGSGVAGSADGLGTAASFNNPYSITADRSGNVYLADWNNHLIRRITYSGSVITLAGTGSIGSLNGTGTNASFNFPTGIVIDSNGNLYVSDSENNLIRKISY